MIQTKRIYEEFSDKDGKRVLVDRIWPRGVSKENARLDEWIKTVAPSTELRTWFGHDPEKFAVFKKKYEKELQEKKEDVQKLKKWAMEGTLTLLYAAKDKTHNQAVVLKEYLERLEGGKI
ncbi:DUF488 domain-containing protein [Fictibacillus sp. Mic-4]|uniref:DUF488 domain-containing protein n=1 Tax=Fictibacillus TaxID=1329200 RepID=UPI00041E5794|nr:DUF488 domain-containing protein [Fictibacillus gelatini]